jgi:predicted ferric reductase
LLVQQLLGVAFILGALHTFAVHGTLDSSPVLTVYLACLTAMGIASLGYRLIGGPAGIGRHGYSVEEVRRLDDDAVEIVMAPAGRPLAFQPGQFVYATFNQSGIAREPHPFTIASAPGDGSLRIAVKRLGDFTGSMMNLRPGSQAQLEGPFGCFCLRSDPAHPQTWIAGGIGITPFLSWARSLDRSMPVDLFDIADRYPALRVIPMRKWSLGHLTVSDIEAVNPNLSHGRVFICGPPLMIDNLATGLATRGVPAHRIHSEAFDFR